MAFLQRGELLQRERVDLAEQGEVALGAGGALLLGGTVERARLRGDDLLAAVLGLLVLGDLDRSRRSGLVGAVLGDQRLDLDAVLVDGTLLELFDAQPLLGAHHLIAVDGVGEPRQFLGQFAAAAPQAEQLPLAHDPVLLGGVALGGGRGDRRAR